MKKLITLVLGIAFFYSCSTSSDGNGNSTTTVVPISPSNLTGVVVSSTQINLSWTDNSTNETGFKIERKTGSGTYNVVGTTATDITIFNDFGLTPGTTYTFRVYSNNAVGNSLTYSNEVTMSTTANLPTLTTNPITNITTNSAISGGNIINDGGSAITSRGVVWDTNPNPTVSLITKTINGSNVGNYSSVLNQISPNTTYYLRAYATTNLGTGYGNEFSFTTISQLFTQGPSLTDIDGNVYSSITNCSQTWMAKNLNVSHYKNGDIIPQALNGTQWANLTTGAWCYYNYDAANGPIYGKLYNWYAVTDSRGLAPDGWHIPSDIEWTTLSNCLGGELVAGGKMKETGTSHWQDPNNATNASGFSALPAGCQMNGGVFTYLGSQAFFWSSTEYSSDTSSAKSRFLRYSNVDLTNDQVRKHSAYSVRCVLGNIQTSPPTLATLTTNSATNLVLNSAVSGGNIINDGGSYITARGVCWSTSPMPTINNYIVNSGQGNGSFSSTISGLSINTTYYVRAFATNSVGTNYGNQVTFTLPSNQNLYVGQSYGGGKIAYIDSSGLHGIIAATFDQSSGIRWSGISPSGFNIQTYSGIGYGTSNTSTIVNFYSSGNYAAKLCSDLVLNGYSDWFLPSIDELEKLYINKNLIGGFSPIWYWSSTNVWAGTGASNGNSRTISFGQGQNSNLPQNALQRVRAVRKF
jgi:uncharacterized protein (TIGR02145 family)